MILDDNSISIFNSINQYISDHLILFIVIISLVGILIYSMTAVFLNKLNKEMYGKTTWMAWIPIFREFLLGKITIHWIFGILLVLALPCSLSVTITINGVTNDYTILPDNIREPFIISYVALCVVLYIYAHFKLANIRANGKGYSSKAIGNSGVVTEYDRRFGNHQNTNDKIPGDNFYSSMNQEVKEINEPPKTLKEVCDKNKIDNNIKKP